jgi:hypothetical protein
MADHDLNVCGKKYSVMVSPWLEPKVLEELTSADFAASIQSSDQSSESTRHEAARELYNMLPPAERNNIDADRIATHVSLTVLQQLPVIADPCMQFVKGVTLQRQTSSHRTRRMIGGDLFGPQVHLKDEERGDHFRHTHLGYLDDKKLYPRRAPVLCAGGAPNIHTLFRRGELIEVCPSPYINILLTWTFSRNTRAMLIDRSRPPLRPPIYPWRNAWPHDFR